MVRRGRPPRNARRFADRGSDVEQRDLRDIKIKRLQQRIRDLEIQHEHPDEDTLSNPSNWEEEENLFGGLRQNLRGMNRDDPLRNLGMKIKIPEFVGKAHPDDFINWLSTLRKSASLWWEHVKNQRVRNGKSKVETWDKMKKLLRAKFLLINHRQEAFLEYHNFSQRTSSSVKDFIAEFDQLCMRCAVKEEEEQVIARFFGALRVDIADVVHLQQYLTYADVLVSTKASSSQQQSDVGAGATVNPTNSRVLRCFKCQGLGHLMKECPNKQLVTILDDVPPVYDTENDDEMVKETEELVYADQGEALVTQRVLNVDMVKTGDDSSWLQNNIFRTKCTTKGKVCTVIIDGGSCDNMVATSMVEKLGLDVKDHPEPYQLTWLKKRKCRQG
ncbi:reverse transcriptase domain-containing protein [Tanacetum coccineum]